MVWLNTRTGVISGWGTRFYGKTRVGEYLSYAAAQLKVKEAEAAAAAKGKKPKFKWYRGKEPANA